MNDMERAIAHAIQANDWAVVTTYLTPGSHRAFAKTFDNAINPTNTRYGMEWLTRKDPEPLPKPTTAPQAPAEGYMVDRLVRKAISDAEGHTAPHAPFITPAPSTIQISVEEAINQQTQKDITNLIDALAPIRNTHTHTLYELN